MRRLAAFVLVVVSFACLLGLAGCASGPDASSSTAREPSTAQEPSTVQEPSTTQGPSTAHLPEKGEPLYRTMMLSSGMPDITETLPSAIRVGIDQGGYLREALFDTPESVQAAAEALAKVRVGDEIDEFVTDNYNYIEVEYDNEFFHASLNLYNLEMTANGEWHIYKLDDLGDLWELAVENAVEVEGSYDAGS